MVGIDSQTVGTDGYRVQQLTGDVEPHPRCLARHLDWVLEVQQRGAGEIVLNCMASDGVRKGYDIAQLRAVRGICRVPLVASGGAGSVQHFADVFRAAGVDAALAASVFHSGEHRDTRSQAAAARRGHRGEDMSGLDPLEWDELEWDKLIGQGRGIAARDRTGRSTAAPCSCSAT